MIRWLAEGSKLLDHEVPKAPDDWIKVADRELENISGSAKIDHAIKATEAALKALFWKIEGLEKWPSKSVSQYSFLYKHNLEVFLDRCNRRAKLKTHLNLWASWRTLVNASVKAHRYLPNVPSDEEVNVVAKSARHPDVGIVPWLKQQYHQVT
jgi:hypothetical protein